MQDEPARHHTNGTVKSDNTPDVIATRKYRELTPPVEEVVDKDGIVQVVEEPLKKEDITTTIPLKKSDISSHVEKLLEKENLTSPVKELLEGDHSSLVKDLPKNDDAIIEELDGDETPPVEELLENDTPVQNTVETDEDSIIDELLKGAETPSIEEDLPEKYEINSIEEFLTKNENLSLEKPLEADRNISVEPLLDGNDTTVQKILDGNGTSPTQEFIEKERVSLNNEIQAFNGEKHSSNSNELNVTNETVACAKEPNDIGRVEENNDLYSSIVDKQADTSNEKLSRDDEISDTDRTSNDLLTEALKEASEVETDDAKKEEQLVELENSSVKVSIALFLLRLL